MTPEEVFSNLVVLTIGIICTSGLMIAYHILYFKVFHITPSISDMLTSPKQDPHIAAYLNDKQEEQEEPTTISMYPVYPPTPENYEKRVKQHYANAYRTME